jgi:hypothetical protein
MRVLRLAAVITLAGSLLVSAAPSSSARVRSGLLVYEGATTGGGSVSFDLYRSPNGTLRFGGWDIFATLTCDDATVVTNNGFGYGFSPGRRLDGRNLDDDRHGLDYRWHIVGRFRNHEAWGQLEFRIATFTAGGDPQACSTGLVDWTAERTFPA